MQPTAGKREGMPSHRGGPRPEVRRVVTDVRVLAALAHPARARLLNHLVEVGPSTATECATVAGVTPSACSYHLRHLARFGLVERTVPLDGVPPDARGRWWRAAQTGLAVLPSPSRHEPATRTAMAALLVEQVAMHADLATDVLARLSELDATWQDAAEFASYGLLVDAAELRDLVQRVDAVLRPYIAVTRAEAPAGAQVVHVTVQAFPRLPPPSR
jgi:DNA-binding transcriptional ArsR family regulator